MRGPLVGVLTTVRRRQMLVHNSQPPFGVENEDLRGASVMDGFFGVLVAAGYYAQPMELKGVTGDGAVVVEQLDIDGAELDLYAGLLAEVFAFAASDGKAPWFCTVADRSEHSGVRGVEPFQQVGSFRRQDIPEPRDFGAHIVGCDFPHQRKVHLKRM